jgi:hypothetical protein
MESKRSDFAAEPHVAGLAALRWLVEPVVTLTDPYLRCLCNSEHLVIGVLVLLEVRSAELRQDSLLVGKNLIQLLLIREDLIQLGLVGLDSFLILQNLALVGEDLLLVGDGGCV